MIMTIIIEDNKNHTKTEWTFVPDDVAKAVETLLYAVEENQDIDMVSCMMEE